MPLYTIYVKGKRVGQELGDNAMNAKYAYANAHPSILKKHIKAKKAR